MRITRLEIFGFKSFVDRFVLNLDHDLIGIVGPNGCGKSNIVDALRWVLGETHAKQLRGSVLEDLIFNGSESRRPLGMAEVSITLRPDKDWSAEKVNTLYDAPPSPTTQLLAIGDDLDGDDGIALVDDADSFDPSDLNGQTQTSETQQGQQEAQGANGVSHTPTGLEEIPGLFEAAELQLTRRLYRSGESEYLINRTRCRLADMLELYRVIGLGARGLSIVQQGQVGQIVSKKPIERRALLEEAAGISGFRARMEVARRRLEKTSLNISRLADLITEVDKQTRILKKQAKRAQERASLKESLKENEMGLFKLRTAKLIKQNETNRAERKILTESVYSLDEAIAQEIQDLEQHRGEQSELEQRSQLLRDQRKELSAELERSRAQFRQLSLALSRADSVRNSVNERIRMTVKRQEELAINKSHAEAHKEDFKKLVEQLQDKRKEAEHALEVLRSQCNPDAKDAEGSMSPEMQTRYSSLREKTQQLDQVNEELAVLRNRAKVCRSDVQASVSRVHEKEIAIAKLESEVASIESYLSRMADEVQACADGVREKGSKVSDDSHRYSILMAGIKVPEGFEMAVNAALGNVAKFLVADDWEQLAQTFEQTGQGVSNGKNKKASFGVVDATVDGGRFLELTDDDFQIAPSVKRLLDIISVDANMQGPVSMMLGSVLVVDALTQALKLQKAWRDSGFFDAVVVTRSGEVVTPWGWWTSDGKTVEVGFARRLEEAKQAIEEHLNLRSDAQAKLEIERSVLTDVERVIQDTERKRSEYVKAGEEMRALLAQVEQEARKRRQDYLIRERSAVSIVSDITNQLTKAQVQHAGEESRIVSLNKELERLKSEVEASARDIEDMSKEYHDLKQQVERYEEDAKAREGSEDSVETKYKNVQAALDVIESQRDGINKTLRAMERSIEQKRGERQSISDKLQSIEVSIEKREVEQQMIFEDLQRSYGEEAVLPTTQEVTSLLEDLERVNSQLKIFAEGATTLRRRLEREGEVDPASIEQYAVESARLEEMQKQYEDLTGAAATLEKTIRQLKDISRAKFLETFEGVRQRFEMIVPRLFGGGAGQLELIDPEDPLTSGVELTVRPPGKKLKSIELLSGGEKAMTATALLFAMFLCHPSPICVLDEVDAPLDDANVERFLDLVREISSKTQMLMITHNKSSMAASDRLVGITMQERGVSTALSVTLDEAEKEIDRFVANA